MAWVIAFAISCIAATWAAVIADEKNRSVVGYALFAFVVPVVGVPVVMLVHPRNEQRPRDAAVVGRT